jgi:hypothetical protein
MPTTNTLENTYLCRGSLTTFLLCVAIAGSAFEVCLDVAFAKPSTSVEELLQLAWPCLVLWALWVLWACGDRHYSIAVLEDRLAIKHLGWRGSITEEIPFQDIASFKVGESRFGPVLVMGLRSGRKMRTRAGLTDFAGMCKRLEANSGKPGILPPWIPV